MSLFGTFRRVKKGKQPSQYYVQEQNTLQIQGQSGLSESVSKLSLSNSTPNLHKLKQLTPSSPSSNQSSVVNVSTTDFEDDSQSTGSVTSAPSAFDSRSGSVLTPRPYVGRKGSFNFSTGQLTRFVSMVAIGSTLRRTTTRRKVSHPHPKGFSVGSKTDMHSNENVDGKDGSLSTSWLCEDVEEMKDSVFIRKNDELLIQHQKELLLGTTRDLMLQGVKKFNRNCAKGMDFFVKNNFVENTPEEVAKFLGTHENLSKIAIGEYLGTYGEFYDKVLHCFVQNHNFKGKGLVEALRIFLASFRLPGEAQKIDRMMETFAHHYCTENPGIFEHEDSCYLLSFAVIMLNTSLHNPNVKEKPTIEQFIGMNRDIDNGKSFDPGFLTHLYNSIRDEEFQIPREDVLAMEAGSPVQHNCLYYFKSPEDTVPRSIIPLENIETSEGTNGKYFTFILTKNSSQAEISGSIKSCKTRSDGTIVLGSHSEYILGTESADDRRRWIFALKQYSSFSSYYTLVQQKKRNMSALLQRRPNRDKNNSSSRIRKATVRKSQISMPLDRPDNDNNELLLPVGNSLTAGSDLSNHEELIEYDDEESLSNYDEQSITEYESDNLTDIQIQVHSPISQSVDDDDDNTSQLSIQINDEISDYVINESAV